MFSGFIFYCRTIIKYDNPRLTAVDLWLTSRPKLSRSDYLAKVQIHIVLFKKKKEKKKNHITYCKV